MHPWRAALACLALTAACSNARPPQAADKAAPPAPPSGRSTCDPDNGGLRLPTGFCAQVVADNVGRARHLVVADDGTIYVNTLDRGVVLLRDTTGDGRADVVQPLGTPPGTGVALRDGWLYYASEDAVYRRRPPDGTPEAVVLGLPAERSHRAKSIALGPDGALYVNIGAPSNACQPRDRARGLPGLDPCPELATRAGVWRFAADRPRQRQADGERWVTGLRNAVALAVRPQDGRLYAVQHGRDQLDLFPPFTAQDNAERPAEEFLRLDRGADFGWPYCYYDLQTRAKVLAPEYGGDGRTIGRCAQAAPTLLALPAHWAPNALLFYRGTQFPARYRGGAFVAFHGSWNRAPLPQGGYNVVFIPFQGDQPTGGWEVFADGFAGPNPQPSTAHHRPSGLAEGPDGSLYIGDSVRGTIWRVRYVGRG